MEQSLLYIIIALGSSIVINLLLKKIGVSQIIGYIITGTTITYALDLHHLSNSHTLETIGEFGIVFLMFTIGLEISLAKMGNMRKEIFLNGFLQVSLTTFVFYLVTFYAFELSYQSSIIISLALSLSSTAVVLSYLKSSKEIYKPYGQLSTGILIFQDLAVIPILILIGFMSSETKLSALEIVLDTVISAGIVLFILFVVGKKVMTWLLDFSESSKVEELFMGSVLFIVVGASLFAHHMGFTYSLGAFVAGMIIAETRYHNKVETDIAPFKDLLLGTFFVVVGMKINFNVFIDNIYIILSSFIGIFILKMIITYVIIYFTSEGKNSLKTALTLSQAGEFAFVIFALAAMENLIKDDLIQLLVLVVIFSMVITPFFITKIGVIVEWLSGERDEAEDMSCLSTRKNHVIVCGYGILGKLVCKELDKIGAEYIIIDNSHKHIKEAYENGLEAYLGDASKKNTLQAIHIETASSILVTLDNIQKKQLICEAAKKESNNANIVVRIISLEEKDLIQNLGINLIVDAKEVTAKKMVNKMQTCSI